jgi:hypothetical protein
MMEAMMRVQMGSDVGGMGGLGMEQMSLDDLMAISVLVSYIYMLCVYMLYVT